MTFLLLLFLALFGHAVLWTGFVNRLHATAIPHRVVNPLSYAALVAVMAIPVALAAWLWQAEIGPLGMGPGVDGRDGTAAAALAELPVGWLVYLAICWIMAVVGIAGWARRHVVARQAYGKTSEVIGRRSSRSVVLEGKSMGQAQATRTLAEERHHHPLLALPGNQCLRIDVAQRSLRLERLHPDLDGFSIVHLSDLHFSGKIGKSYFQEVVRLSNEQKPDMVAITGDLVDKTRCFDWIPDTLGKLQSRCGVYFVLGNHDLLIDTRRLRATLTELGMVDLGGRWKEIRVDRNFDVLKSDGGGQDGGGPEGYSIVLAGNELPWIPPAADMRTAPARRPDEQPLRILLAHSPDQLDWAAAADFDLMLAGHLHGGQIRIPLIGPILSPSRKGVKYASGTFYSRPTVLHVSRGISSELPVRFNCEPELALLVLSKKVQDP